MCYKTLVHAFGLIIMILGFPVAASASSHFCLISHNNSPITARIQLGVNEHIPNYTEVVAIAPLDGRRYVLIETLDKTITGTVDNRFLADVSLCSEAPPVNGDIPSDSVDGDNQAPTSPTPVNNMGALSIDACAEQYTGNEKAIQQCDRDTLFNMSVSGRKTMSYHTAREVMFQDIDAKYRENGTKYAESVYSNDVLEIKSSSGIPGGDYFNTEHTRPQAQLKRYPNFNSSQADIYHLFPVEQKINGKRSSLPFVECAGEPTDQTGRVPEMCDAGFEPPEQQKGIIARAMFYISLSYNIPIPNGEEPVLKAWNNKFPPTAEEIERGSRIQARQGNVNPFITHPEWADLIADY